MNKICGIYKITSPSKKVYIGQSTNIKIRWWKYKNIKCENQRRLYNSLKKYGIEKHKFEILHQCEPEKLNELEVYYIELFQCFNNEYGLNLKSGGHNDVHSEESKRKISETLKGSVRSEETKRKISETMKDKKRSGYHIKRLKERIMGEKNPNFGKKHTEEHKRKISESCKGRLCSEEMKIKISKALKGKKTTIITKLRMSEAAKKRWKTYKIK